MFRWEIWLLKQQKKEQHCQNGYCYTNRLHQKEQHKTFLEHLIPMEAYFGERVNCTKILTLIGLGTQDHNFIALEDLLGLFTNALGYLTYTCITVHYLNTMLS